MASPRFFVRALVDGTPVFLAPEADPGRQPGEFPLGLVTTPIPAPLSRMGAAALQLIAGQHPDQITDVEIIPATAEALLQAVRDLHRPIADSTNVTEPPPGHVCTICDPFEPDLDGTNLNPHVVDGCATCIDAELGLPLPWPCPTAAIGMVLARG